MAKGTEVAKVDDASTELTAALAAEEEALVAANQSEVDASEFTVPVLKLAQPLTDEVTSGDAKAGQFVLGLTGEAFDGPFEFVVAGKGKGRFRPGRGGERTLVAYDTNTVPWKDDPFFGQPFSEHPDAEEQFKARVDAGDQEWGHGPPIQTTFNYTGYIVGSEVPVRISLRRTSAPAARKWNMLLDAVLRGRYWDKVFNVSSELAKNEKGTYYVATVNLGRAASSDEKTAAIGLATALRNQRVVTVGESDDAPTKEPDAAGGLEV
jgi:multidrug efflux pump subunit AcrA (membrane-fusion protein)